MWIIISLLIRTVLEIRFYTNGQNVQEAQRKYTYLFKDLIIYNNQYVIGFRTSDFQVNRFTFIVEMYAKS